METLITSKKTLRRSKAPEFFVGEIKEVYSANASVSDMPCVRDSKAVEAYAREVWEQGTLEIYECFYAFYLNRANRICGWSQISKGGTAGTVADPKLIFRRALMCGASGIILAHNHPSGNRSASQTDIELTKKLRSAGQFLEIQVLDHLILTPSSYMSFAEEGLI